MSTLDCITPPNPSGLCMCGCGKRTKLAAQTINRWGHVRGHPVKFIQGHHKRRSSPDFIVDEETGCWNWQGAQSNGYGRRRKDGKVQSVHRVVWEENNGPIPEGLQVLHHCDNPPCCNPEHLFLGTQADNVADMISKNRDARGERRGNSKLTEADVRAMRRAYARGNVTGVALAEKYGVGKAVVSTVVRMDSWRHVL